jgi:iron complex outermembrane receptor protein
MSTKSYVGSHLTHGRRARYTPAAAALTSVLAAATFSTPSTAQDAAPAADAGADEVTVVARRREESAQDVPIPVSVVGGERIDDVGAFNVNRVKELVPTVQLYSSNPRNTTVNIRGLGSTFGLTNDGVDAGVGIYVDGVFHARPAATTLDFIDIEQVEVLRGPQGTLFGKNTTAGAILLTTRAPSFEPEATVEIGYGTDNFVQTKVSVTGPLAEKLAGRLSLSSTQRDGQVHNVLTGEDVNELDNLGVRAQLLYAVNDNIDIKASLDWSEQNPNGQAQVLGGVAPTMRAPYRQFDAIIADLNYTPVSLNPYDRLIDQDTPWRSGNELGGVALSIGAAVGSGTLTSTTAWRFWKWRPSNDRDFTGLPVLSLSQAPSDQDQWTQEVRWAGDFAPRIGGVFGFFTFGQTLEGAPFHTDESGPAQWRFSQSTTSPLWATPGLLDGYGIRTSAGSEALSAAVFAQLDIGLTDRLTLLPGMRYNYDEKKVDFDRTTYGGLQTSDPALLAIQRSVYSPQAFTADIDDTNTSGQLTLDFQATERVKAYVTLSTAFKPVGLNVGGLPTDAAGAPIMDAAVIRSEDVRHAELGVKLTPTTRSTANFTFYQTGVEDYQTSVQNAQLGVNRGYLANAEKVRVRGAEFDGNVQLGNHVSLHGALAYADAIYVSFPDAPVSLEETGGTASSKDISGQRLPGVSKWAGSFGGEIAFPVRGGGEIFGGFDTYYRTDFSSSPTPSAYLVADGYGLVNLRLGFRAARAWSGHLWVRNALDEDYVELLLPAAGNAGHYAAVLGDERTYGATFRYSFD